MTTTLFATSLVLWAAAGPPAPEVPPARLVTAAVAALAGAPDAPRLVQRLAARYPDRPTARTVRGLHALLTGDLRAAERALPVRGDLAPYRAMALVHRPGGLAQATHALAEAAREDDATPGTLFLAALAFARTERDEQAHSLLSRALDAAPSVLDESFAPDPAVALARLAVEASDVAARAQTRLRVAEALIEAGRRGAARRLVEGLRGSRAAKIRWASWHRVSPRRAVAAARAGADERADLQLVVAEADFEAGRTPRVPRGALPGAAWRARRDRLLARMALGARRPGDALELARAVARADPDHAGGVALLVEALLANNEARRAAAFADVLLSRRPLDVNPFESMLAVRKASPDRRPVKALELRSRGWQQSEAELKTARARRERILAAARDADAGLGATGLAAVRAEDATIALTADLALARHGAVGAARAARERVLAACGPHLKTWLQRRGDWDFSEVTVSPYGRSQTVRVLLSDADPGRCPGDLGRVQRGGRR